MIGVKNPLHVLEDPQTMQIVAVNLVEGSILQDLLDAQSNMPPCHESRQGGEMVVNTHCSFQGMTCEAAEHLAGVKT